MKITINNKPSQEALKNFAKILNDICLEYCKKDNKNEHTAISITN